MRVLSRALKRAQTLFAGRDDDLPRDTFRDRTRSARKQARKISESAGKKSEKAGEQLRDTSQRLMGLPLAILDQSKRVLRALGSLPANQTLPQTLKTFIPRVEQALDQAIRRVLLLEAVPAREKIVSLFEPPTAIIQRGKANKPVECGCKIWLDEVEGGIVSGWRILSGNPSDQEQWRDSLEHHRHLFGRTPTQASADRGVFSPENERYAQSLGVRRIVLPQPGHKSTQRRALERSPWFRRAYRFPIGVEDRISVLKRKHGLNRCLDHGERGFGRWVGWGILAGNLAVMGTALAK